MKKPEINFYEVTNDNFEKVVCSLIEKCYKTGINTLVHTEDEGMQEILNKMLWTFSQKSFIPHGSILDERIEDQPVLISHKTENFNQSKLLVMVAGAYMNPEEYERVFIVFFNQSEVQKNLARKIYQDLKAQEHNICIYKQNITGTWDKNR
ncbi:MAG: DNA polymerase III subunit chi [Rickettsiaceae bacterium]|nr:DNA polymerase III subunit chi [Rickettsiaceae bacterium]